MQKHANKTRAIVHLSEMLNFESSLFKLVNDFVVSNFMCCPLIWHMCSVSDCKKKETVQERVPLYVPTDFNDTYCNLLQRASKRVLYILHLRIIAIEIQGHPLIIYAKYLIKA